MDNNPEKKETPAPAKAEKIIVTSSKSVDWPSLNWGINAGEQRELPGSKDAQDIILSNEYISKIK